jgi:hypothetical protein
MVVVKRIIKYSWEKFTDGQTQGDPYKSGVNFYELGPYVGFAPLDFEPGKYSAQQVASYYMDVRVAVYQTDGKWKATVSATSFVSAVNGTLIANASTSLVVNGKTIGTQSLYPIGTNLVPGGNQYMYMGETTFNLPNSGIVSLNFLGGWAIEYEAGRFVPINAPYVGVPISATSTFKLR